MGILPTSLSPPFEREETRLVRQTGSRPEVFVPSSSSPFIITSCFFFGMLYYYYYCVAVEAVRQHTLLVESDGSHDGEHTQLWIHPCPLLLLTQPTP